MTRRNTNRVRLIVLAITGLLLLCAVGLRANHSSTAQTTNLLPGAYLPIVIRDTTPTPTATSTPTNTPTPTLSPSQTPTNTPTQTPTNTPTQTPTNTPTPTATPTATKKPGTVQILSNHTSYVDIIDYLNVVGEVENTTSNHLQFVRITGNFFNSSGQLLDTGSTYIWPLNLPAGQKTCFQLSVPEPAGWSYYQFEPVSYQTYGHPLPNLAIFNHSGSYNSTFGWYEIIGMVRNDHGTRVEYVSPVGTVYNAAGKVVGCELTFVNATHLDAGQTSSFEMTFLGRDYSDVASYRLQVDGNPQ